MSTLADIQTVLNKEFSRTMSKVQSIVGFKEIMMKPRETPWGFDQTLKCMIHEANMNLTDGQHHEWFVASLFFTFEDTQCNDLVIILYRNIDTSCNRFCQCSSSSSESDVQDILRSHAIHLSTVEFTQF